MVKNPPAMRETWVRSLGWEDPLEHGMTTHSSILAWRTPWTEEPGGHRSQNHTGSDTTEQLSITQCTVVHTYLLNPQYVPGPFVGTAASEVKVTQSCLTL